VLEVEWGGAATPIEGGRGGLGGLVAATRRVSRHRRPEAAAARRVFQQLVEAAKRVFRRLLAAAK